MNIGDRIKFPFGGEEKEGVVVKIFPKKVYLKVDFPHHPGKMVVRALADLEGKTSPNKKKREKRAKARKEKREKAEKAQRAEVPKGEEGKE